MHMHTHMQVFRSVMKRFNLAAGDFPDIVEFQEKLKVRGEGMGGDGI